MSTPKPPSVPETMPAVWLADRAISLREVPVPTPAPGEALALCGESIENGLFTAMRFHAETMEVERIFSSLPAVYPVSGRKPKRDPEWGAKVLVERRPNLGSGAADIKWSFSDHETILGLDLTEVLNVPVIRSDMARPKRARAGLKAAAAWHSNIRDNRRSRYRLGVRIDC